MAMGGVIAEQRKSGDRQLGRTLTGIRGLANLKGKEREPEIRNLPLTGQEALGGGRGRSLGKGATKGIGASMRGGVRGRGNPAMHRFRRGY